MQHPQARSPRDRGARGLRGGCPGDGAARRGAARASPRPLPWACARPGRHGGGGGGGGPEVGGRESAVGAAWTRAGPRCGRAGRLRGRTGPAAVQAPRHLLARLLPGADGVRAPVPGQRAGASALRALQQRRREQRPRAPAPRPGPRARADPGSPHAARGHQGEDSRLAALQALHGEPVTAAAQPTTSTLLPASFAPRAPPARRARGRGACTLLGWRGLGPELPAVPLSLRWGTSGRSSWSPTGITSSEPSASSRCSLVSQLGALGKGQGLRFGGRLEARFGHVTSVLKMAASK